MAGSKFEQLAKRGFLSPEEIQAAAFNKEISGGAAEDLIEQARHAESLREPGRNLSQGELAILRGDPLPEGSRESRFEQMLAIQNERGQLTDQDIARLFDQKTGGQ